MAILTCGFAELREYFFCNVRDDKAKISSVDSIFIARATYRSRKVSRWLMGKVIPSEKRVIMFKNNVMVYTERRVYVNLLGEPGQAYTLVI